MQPTRFTPISLREDERRGIKMSQISLETEFCGFKLINPFLLAPTPMTASAEMITRAFGRGWAGAVWKTIGIVSGVSSPKVSPRYLALRDDGHDPIGFENIDLGNARSYDESFSEMEQVKERFPRHMIIASIRGESDSNAWQELAIRADQAGADALEAMFSCPHDTEHGSQSANGNWGRTMRQIAEWIRAVSSLPLAVKMSPNVADMRFQARIAASCGVTGVSVANTVRCLGGVDLDTLRPIPSVDGFSTFGGYSGPAIKPIILRFVAELASDSECGVAISGVGGISSWQDAVEYLLLGASSLQIGTGAMVYGQRIIDDLLDGLIQFMGRHEFESIPDLVGASLPYLIPHQELDRGHRVVPEIDLATCSRCGRCYLACTDGGESAIHFGPDRIPSVESETCSGCGLCAQVCPVEGCIDMVDVRTRSRVLSEDGSGAGREGAGQTLEQPQVHLSGEAESRRAAQN
jgi:dihydropyrimidine dehydrogenase (NAD+) subunit PreA